MNNLQAKAEEDGNVDALFAYKAQIEETESRKTLNVGISYELRPTDTRYLSAWNIGDQAAIRVQHLWIILLLDGQRRTPQIALRGFRDLVGSSAFMSVAINQVEHGRHGRKSGTCLQS